MALIEVQNITKIFGSAPKKELAKVQNGMGKEQLLAETGHTLGLNNVSLSIEKGEIFVIMGLSGSGKSTLIRHFNRLIDPTDGHILVDGMDVMGLSNKELEDFRRHRMSMVFQRFGLMPHRTVLQNVAYGLEVQGIAKAEREATARKWIETVELAGFEDQYPSQLSGGMQQRVGLARALATDSDIILMDEAFSALDPLIRSQMQDQLVELHEKLHKTIVFITHDLDEALRIGDKIAILKDGVLSQVGTPPEILLEPADDYVRAFVRDVNRARVLTVGTVMQPPALRITHDNMEKALADMRHNDEDFGYVIENKEFRGVVTQEALAEEVAKQGDTPSLYAFADDSSVVELENTLEEALPATLEADYPVPVVCEDGRLMGVLSSEEMGSALTPPDELENGDTEGTGDKGANGEAAKADVLKEAS